MNLSIRSLLFPLTATLLLATSLNGRAQKAYAFKIAQDRMLWHDNVDKEQQRLIALGGNPRDSVIRLSKDENVNRQVTDALIRQVDVLQERIELDSTLNTKIGRAHV